MKEVDALTRVEEWWRRGAMSNGHVVAFDDDWRFPYGTNHLSSVEIWASGAVYPSLKDPNPIAELFTKLSLAPHDTEVFVGRTTNNSYRIEWHGGHPSRDLNQTADASIELFRNGDWCVTENGVARSGQRVLPFPHAGFGQDDEWVAANFTNVTEILAVGYPQWVDQQVGEGLTNGLYKLTVSLADDPPETTFLFVGDLSVAVTNAGDYVFLLGKGMCYPLSVYPESVTNVVYAAVDDVQMSRPAPLPQLRSGSSGSWSTVSGTLEIVVPIFPMVPQGESAHIVWHPTLVVSPCTWQPAPLDSARQFTAVLTDVPWFMPSPSFAWSSVGEAPVSVNDPASESATMTCAFPAAYGKNVQLLLDVDIGSMHLQSVFSGIVEDFDEGDCESAYLGSVGPCLLVDASPAVVFFEKSFGNTSSAGFACRYNVDVAGTFSLSMSNEECLVRDSLLNVVDNGYTWRVEEAGSGVKHFTAHSPVSSSSPSGTVFTVTFTPDDEGSSMADSAGVVFVEWETETTAIWPQDRSRRTIGVCEEVLIYLRPFVDGLSLFKSESDSFLIKESPNNRWKYTAPCHASADAIGTSDSGSMFSFDVIEPTGYASELVAIDRHGAPCGVAGEFEMWLDLTLLPTNVSFANIHVMEVGMVSTNATGYFLEPAHTNLLVHSHTQGADTWISVGAFNKLSDKAGPEELSQPWGVGGEMTWPIPNRFIKPGAATDKYFCNTDECFSLTSNGTVRVEKFDWYASATTNRVFSYGRR